MCEDLFTRAREHNLAKAKELANRLSLLAEKLHVALDAGNASYLEKLMATEEVTSELMTTAMWLGPQFYEAWQREKHRIVSSN